MANGDLPPLDPEVIESVSRYCLVITNMALAEVISRIESAISRDQFLSHFAREAGRLVDGSRPEAPEAHADAARTNVAGIRDLVEGLLSEREGGYHRT